MRSRYAVAVAAIAAPLLHAFSDLLEWRAGGFTPLQLGINLVAFLPMPLLLGALCGAQPVARRTRAGAIGALLYGLAFTYFLYSTIYALGRATPDYETLWRELGAAYTLAGALMVAGGALFAGDALQARWYPRGAAALFLVGSLANLVIAMLPVPEIVQIAGSLVRNAGLAGCGLFLLRRG